MVNPENDWKILEGKLVFAEGVVKNSENRSENRPEMNFWAERWKDAEAPYITSFNLKPIAAVLPTFRSRQNVQAR